ncbi:nitroreductase family protein [Cohnella lubricantis]|uniref:Nitroreductase family protein n=1 Tax=Cohnella lubricantis TaxID=2163172 RepID=A0A841TE17_9BACL|nr:nitroreductase family protein [Cohnella lubricantis]MBB6676691.1 nitroreductase family protein [Cohnella lubricantis]MBP2117737.1 nitroreductase [Cohnella lubricantis]
MSTTTAQTADYRTVVRERRSVRHYDPTFKIPDSELREMLEEASLAPSSSNSQTWRFLVITNDEAKKRLHPIANGQQQVLDASAVIVVLGDLDGYKEMTRIYGDAVRAGYMPEDFAKQYLERSLPMYAGLSPEKMRNLVGFDGGLVSMQFMLTAKSRGYDTVPMGGFNPEKLIEEFKLPSNLAPLLLIAVGRASTPGRPTVRLPIDDITFWNKIEQ